jgi:hypothetical protein
VKYNFFFIFIIGGVGLSPGTAATSGLLYKPQMIDEGDCGAIGGMKIGRGNRRTRRKPAPVPLCPPQIPQTKKLYQYIEGDHLDQHTLMRNWSLELRSSRNRYGAWFDRSTWKYQAEHNRNCEEIETTSHSVMRRPCVTGGH